MALHVGGEILWEDWRFSTEDTYNAHMWEIFPHIVPATNPVVQLIASSKKIELYMIQSIILSMYL